MWKCHVCGDETKTECFRCGNYVCINCSRRKTYKSFGRVRLCTNCMVELEDIKERDNMPKGKLVTRYIAFNRDIFEDPENGSCVYGDSKRDKTEFLREYDFYVEVKGYTEEDIVAKAKCVGTVTVNDKG